MNIQIACDVLNEAFAADPKAIDQLLNFKVEANGALVAHPTIPSTLQKRGPETLPVIGLLDILNGILLGAGKGRLMAVYEDTDTDGVLIPYGRRRFTGFKIA